MDIEDQDLLDPPDFDFFDSPRNTGSRSPMDISPQMSTKVTSKPPTSIKSTVAEHGESATSNSRSEQNMKTVATSEQKREPHQRKGESTFSYSSGSDSETDSISSYSSNCSQQSVASSATGNDVQIARMVDSHRRSLEKHDRYSSATCSSSAYSDGSSDEGTPLKESPKVNKPMPMERKSKFSKQAWGKDSECKKDHIDVEVKKTDDKKSRHITFKKERARKKRSERKYVASDSNDSISELSDSDMTDVSPLGSPEPSPSMPRKNKKVTITNHTLEHKPEQHSPEYNHERNPGDVLLKTSQIDMGILMHAVSEIEKERQDRIKANTRRVMFAPPKKYEKDNYSFNSDRTKIIEKENQRLLKELMKHISSTGKHKDQNAEPKKNLSMSSTSSSTSSSRRPTTAAINRRKDQHRIEGENWGLLQRLKKAQPTRGMSRNEQLTEYQQAVRYCAPSSNQKRLRGALSAYENSLRLGSRTHSMTSISSSGSSRKRWFKTWQC
ncbi:hypothetical protein ScPMuIL_011456 [Solemya velum]